MFTTMKRFFAFCNEEDRKKLYLAIALGTVKAIFAALRISAIGVIVMGVPIAALPLNEKLRYV